MKKFVSVTLSLLLLTAALTSCSEAENENTTSGAGTEETTLNMPVSGSENSSQDLNENTPEPGSSDAPSFG